MRQVRFAVKPLVAAVAAMSLLLQPIASTFAANNVNSNIAASAPNVINLTANVDWDYDTTSPIQANGTIALTKEVVRNQILREVARSVFLMTEGRHRIGTIYVFKNKGYADNVDIRILNSNGRSNASVSAWKSDPGTTSNFLSSGGKADNLRDYARVVAHELGHYVYGFLDEYREADVAASTNGSPGGNDFTRTSIMNDHTLFTRLSTAEDYANGNAAQNNTAQARAYSTDAVNLRGGSHWEMLTRDPANDSALAKSEHGGRRVFFDAFRNLTAPASVAQLGRYFGVFCDPTLVQAVCGNAPAPLDQVVPASDRIATLDAYNARLYTASGGTGGVDAVDGAPGTAFESFNVVFAEAPAVSALGAPVVALATTGTGGEGLRRLPFSRLAVQSSAAVARHVIVLDRTLPAATLAQARATAEHLLERASAGSQWAILLSPSSSSSPLVPMTSIDTGRTTLLAAIRGATRIDGSVDVAAAYAQAAPLLAAGRTAADTASIELLTAQGTTVPLALGTTARDARTTVNPIALLATGAIAVTVPGGVGLEALAHSSGGTLVNARNAEQATKAAQRVQQENAGEVFALLSTTTTDTLPVGTTSTSFTISKYDSHVGVQFVFDPADRGKLQFRVVTPAGTVSTLSADSSLDEGYAVIALDNTVGAYNGNVRAEVVASAAVTNPVGVDVEAVSDLLMTPTLDGGSATENRAPVLKVRLAANFPVTKASVQATIYRVSDGQAVLRNLALVDDGAGADSRADDGIYSVSLAGLLPAGDYYAAVQARTTDASVFQPNQRFAVGGTYAVTPVGAGVVRADEVDFTLEVGATGVNGVTGGTSAPTASGGGCTVAPDQRDATLLMLLAMAVYGLVRRLHGRRA